MNVGGVAAGLGQGEPHGVAAGQKDATGEVAAFTHDPMAAPIALDVEVVCRTDWMRVEVWHDGANSCFNGAWIKGPCRV